MERKDGPHGMHTGLGVCECVCVSGEVVQQWALFPPSRTP